MTINPMTTPNTPDSFSPDLTVFTPGDAVPDALILRASTVVTTELEGDAPVARVPWVNDADAQFVPEGTFIEPAAPTPDEITVTTGKIAQVVTVSREQWHQQSTAGLLSNSVTRAVTKAGNQAFLAQPTGQGYPPLTGISNTEGIIEGQDVTTSLDPIADVIAEIENNGGTPNLIIANPLSFGALRNLKTGEGSYTSLLGAGTADVERKLLGVEVVTSPAVPEGELIVIDSTAIASAVGAVQIAQSEHAHFAYDSIAVRVTWRIGWAVQHADRLGKLTVTVPSEEGSDEGTDAGTDE